MTVGVTGATGRVGGRVARALAAAGVEQRLLVRSPERAPSLAHASLAAASYGDARAVQRGLEGIDVVLFVSAAESANRLQQHETFVVAAKDAGVRHVVYTSFCGAAPDSVFTLGRDHFATEELLRSSGMAWTFLRDNIYADFLPLMAGDDGVIRGPADGGRVSAVAIADVADCAVAVLTDPGPHAGAGYDLTGPEAFTLAEAAEVLTETFGTTYAFVDETLEEAYASRARYGAEQWQLDAWVSTYLAIASGRLALVSGDVPRLTGHPARALRQTLLQGLDG